LRLLQSSGVLAPSPKSVTDAAGFTAPRQEFAMRSPSAATVVALLLAAAALPALAQVSDPDFSATPRPRSGIDARVGGVTAGTPVQSTRGESLGTVKDIVPDLNSGRPAYVLIESGKARTAVPYSSIVPLVHDGHIVVDRVRLESAPQVREADVQALDAGAHWRREADRYWREGS
jgi:sporulation protein YlmC with PRC-barrel domain